MLKLKFKKLHSTVVGGVNVANIVDLLFQEGVLGHQDARALQRQSHPQQQCRDLLMLLHSSDHPQAFVQLYRAVMNESQLHWLVDCIEEINDRVVQEQRYLSEPSGKRGASKTCNYPSLCHRPHRRTHYALQYM